MATPSRARPAPTAAARPPRPRRADGRAPLARRHLASLPGWRRWLAVAAIGGLAVVPLLAALGAWSDGWQPTGDVAIIGVRSLDAWTLHPPLVGQPTTGDTYADVASAHPGPFEYWAIGPFVRLLGPSLGMVLAVALVNGAALGAIAWVAFRRGGTVLLGIATLGLAALVRSLGVAALYDPYNSELATFPMVLTALTAWSVVAGDRRLLPLLAAAATVSAQTHVSGAVVVAPVVALTAGVLVHQVRARRWRPADDHRTLVATGAVLAIGWLPVVARELTGPSNLWALARTSMAPHLEMGVAFALERVVGSVTLPPLFVWTPPELVYTGTANALGVVIASLVAGGTVALVLSLRARTGHQAGRAIGFLGLVVASMAMASVWTTAKAPPISAIRSDVARAMWVVSLLVWILAAWSAWQHLGPDRRRRWGPHVLPVSSAVALVLVLVALLGADLEDQRDGLVMGTVDLVSDRALAELPRGTYRVTLDGETAALTVGPGIVLRLEDGGRKVVLPASAFADAYGDRRSGSERPVDGELRITTGPVPAPRDGERLVAEAPLPSSVQGSVYVFLVPSDEL